MILFCFQIIMRRCQVLYLNKKYKKYFILKFCSTFNFFGKYFYLIQKRESVQIFSIWILNNGEQFNILAAAKSQ